MHLDSLVIAEIDKISISGQRDLLLEAISDVC